MTRKITKRFTALTVAMLLIISCFSTTTFAAEPELNENVASVTTETPNTEISRRGTWPVGDHYLGYCNITNKNHLGGAHVFNGNYIQLKPAWKPLDDTSKEVDMYMEVRDMTLGGTVVYQHRFTIKEDKDGRKDNGYWYAESKWFPITKGHTFRIYYEPFTSTGYTGTGSNRQATCVLYVNVGD